MVWSFFTVTLTLVCCRGSHPPRYRAYTCCTADRSRPPHPTSATVIKGWHAGSVPEGMPAQEVCRWNTMYFVIIAEVDSRGKPHQ